MSRLREVGTRLRALVSGSRLDRPEVRVVRMSESSGLTSNVGPAPWSRSSFVAMK